MATSALGGALKPLPSGDTEAEDKYKAALDRITAALDARENRAFDPQLMALAQGFLSPTKTGSFGESIGQAAGAVIPVQQQQEKEAMENAQFRLQLAQAEKEQANLTAAQKAYQEATGAGGDFQPVSLQAAQTFIGRFPTQKELGARMMEAAKAGLDRYQMSMNGIVFDKMTGKYLNVDIPGQTQADFSTPYGTFKMLPNEYSRFTMAQKAGLGKEWMDAFKRGEQFGVDQLVAQRLEGGAAPSAVKPAAGAGAAVEPPAVKTAPTGAGEPSADGRITVAQQEAQAAAQKATAEQRAKGENTRYQSIMDNGTAAGSKISTYKTMDNVINRKGMDTILGYFERPDFLSAAGKFIESGRWGSEALREVLQNLGAPQELIDNKMLLNSLVNQVGVEFSRLNKGQGAVSDYERTLYQSLGPNAKDPIGAFRKKTAMLNARAEFERDIARALKNSNMDADNFVLSSPQYENALNTYYRTLERIVYGEPQGGKAPTVGGTSPQDLIRARNEAKKRMQGG